MSRGSGRTTKQMQDAKFRSVFIVSGGNINYYRNLAKKHGREDLYIIPICDLVDKSYYKLDGIRIGSVIIDHSITDVRSTTELEEVGLNWLLALVRT